jgi:hypothetical protein
MLAYKKASMWPWNDSLYIGQIKIYKIKLMIFKIRE